MAVERYQNPVVDNTVRLRLFSYNSNSRMNFTSIDKVEIYYLDDSARTAENPDGRTLLQTITTDITNVETGQYMVEVDLTPPAFVIGRYLDIWYVNVNSDDSVQPTVINEFQVYPNLWFTSPTPVVYDFSFTARPNKIRQGSKKYLLINVVPNVPKASDIARYYENLAIVSPIKISIKQNCGLCLPAEEDLRIKVDEELIELREKNTAYYFLDTTEWDCGIYDVWFSMDFGESTYISDIQQIQIY